MDSDLFRNQRYLRQLVGDEQAADGLEQATCLAALERTPRPSHVLRSWLARVLGLRRPSRAPFLLFATLPFQAAGPAQGWDALAQEYEQAYMRWGSELSRSGEWEKPAGERPLSPAVTYWPRFEALSAAGDGRATLCMLRELSCEPAKRAERAAVLFERVRAAGTAAWVANALDELVLAENQLPRTALAKHVQTLARTATELELRVAVLRAQAALTEDRARAEELELHVAFLRWKGVELGDDERVEGELLAELAPALLNGLRDSKWFEANMFEGDDGIYYLRAAFEPDPRERWRRAIETLAARDSLPARIWVLTNSSPSTEAEKVRFCEHLDAVARATLTNEERKSLLWNVGPWTSLLGGEFVEPRVRAIASGASEPDQARLLAGLGEGLCEAASDDAAREKGLALLREVTERWPTTDAAATAKSKLFRYTNLVVGKPAPDFETVDADGLAFKLSDYKGKVTVLDFWGFW